MALLSSLFLAGGWEEPEEGENSDLELQEPRNGEESVAQPLCPARVFPTARGLANPCLLPTASLLAQVVLSFQAYPTTRCALLEIQVPAVLVQPGQSVVCEVLLLLSSHILNLTFPPPSRAVFL